MTSRIVYETENANNGCSHGLVLIDEVSYFFKRRPGHTMQREREGYEMTAGYYPVAAYKGTHQDDKGTMILYEYLQELNEPGGLLSDLLDDRFNGLVDTLPICEMYLKVFQETLDTRICDTHDVFFSERLSTRVDVFYDPKFIKDWTGKKTVINGTPVTINLQSITTSLQHFFNRVGPELSIVSQADPAEYNLSPKPLLLDYEAGGHTPVMAEFAIMNAITTIFGDYVARKYNPNFFVRRGLLTINEPVRQQDGSIHRHINKRRVEFLNQYAKEVMSKVITPSRLTRDLKDAYRHYYAMKILGVFNIATFPTVEIEYLLGHLQHIFDNIEKCDTMEDITRIVVE